MTWNSLHELTDNQLSSALQGDGLRLSSGRFQYRLRARARYVLPFLKDQYRDFPVTIEAGVDHFDLKLEAPKWWRNWIRPQVAPVAPTALPVIPLPISLSPLALEMGMNLYAALGVMRVMLLHAAVVSGKEGAVLISAASGMGKSTLCSALMQEGYRLHSDEFGMVDPVTGELHAFPRPVSLKNQSIDVVKEFAGADWVSDTLKDTPKGEVAYRRVRKSDIDSAHQRSKCKLIVFPIFELGRKTPTIKPMDPGEAAIRLIPSSTNYHHLGEAGYNALMALVSGSEAFEVRYGSTEQSLNILKGLGFGGVKL